MNFWFTILFVSTLGERFIDRSDNRIDRSSLRAKQLQGKPDD